MSDETVLPFLIPSLVLIINNIFIDAVYSFTEKQIAIFKNTFPETKNNTMYSSINAKTLCIQANSCDSSMCDYFFFEITKVK